MVVCIACRGSGELTHKNLKESCPICEGDPKFFSEETQHDNRNNNAVRVPPTRKRPAFWVDLGSWVRFDYETEKKLIAAEKAGETEVRYRARGQEYLVNLELMEQANARTGVCRSVKRTEEDEVEEASDEEGSDEDHPFCGGPRGRQVPLVELPPRPDRLERLVRRLLSSAVQVPLPAEAEEETLRLSDEEVRKVFVDQVPGVEAFLFRDQPGEYSLKFIGFAYKSGLRAFEGTPMENHLMWLMRLIVHHGHDRKPGAARYLKDVAEAFLDCQAVQARVIERAGLEILGVRSNFQGLVTSFVGDYKTMAIKMLAHEHIKRGIVGDDGNPTHYENRLTHDLGDTLGLNQDDIRRAELDSHAANRFPRLTGKRLQDAAERCRQFFDLEALIRALASECNSLGEASPPESLARCFVDWASERLHEKHVIFDEETCSKVAVEEPLAIAVLETLFLGKVGCNETELYRGGHVCKLFRPEADPAESPVNVRDRILQFETSSPKKGSTESIASSKGKGNGKGSKRR
eukprot:TRINITY_DN9200_c0_g1_i1.p1 TRINITY_DN9200_c0_g1~~TRINITY_DN9200_c0_g1_i1.p1  ORF type:complete len:519 (-),score=111.59 TRINITY_DN9200_c0_g1_i1:57-1613(-)